MSDLLCATDDCVPSCASTLALGQTSRDSLMLGLVRIVEVSLCKKTIPVTCHGGP
jgi:hypothetical protein